MGILSVNNLQKRYNRGKVVALHGLDFDVQEGEIYGIIGPDGAAVFRFIRTFP